jgi:hypothetical protein
MSAERDSHHYSGGQMFFYEIRIARAQKTPGGKRRSTTTEYMEALKPAYVGEKVASLLGNRSVIRVTVEPINQARFVRATRGD